MIKQVRHPYLGSIEIERDAPSETGFILSVDALTHALREEWYTRVKKLAEIYGITQQVELYTDIAYLTKPQYDTTKDQNEYKSDANPF